MNVRPTGKGLKDTMKVEKRLAFTLVEVLIVVVIMAVLAATIIPQFSNSADDARTSTSEFNLHTLRSQIELYRGQHGGILPTSALAELTSSTNVGGTVGTGSSYPYGPYVREVPSNPFSNSAAVKVITTSPAQSSDVTGTGGWLYNVTTGEIWIDHADHYDK